LIGRHAAATETPLGDLLAAMHVQDGITRPSAIERLSFSQYIHVMYSPAGTPIFEPVMGSRSIFRASFVPDDGAGVMGGERRSLLMRLADAHPKSRAITRSNRLPDERPASG
jgi:hypothetical protein